MGARQRQKANVGYRRILWPTDFSPLAAAALPHALKLARESGAELVVLHVLPLAALFALPEMVGVAWEHGEAELHRVTEHVKGKAPTLRVHGVVAKGVAFDQIVRVAQRLRCDLIVLATHGRTGLQHVLMGSVAENVARRASCPVLTVRPPRFMR